MEGGEGEDGRREEGKGGRGEEEHADKHSIEQGGGRETCGMRNIERPIISKVESAKRNKSIESSVLWTCSNFGSILVASCPNPLLFR